MIIDFPSAYNEIWDQIPKPTTLNITINSVKYTSTMITLIPGRLFAQFTENTFASQVTFSSLLAEFEFRNPNKSIDCSVQPVFKVSLFDFKGNNINAQSLSNNQICPELTNRLFGINVTGNTKISAGSSSVFIISI